MNLKLKSDALSLQSNFDWDEHEMEQGEIPDVTGTISERLYRDNFVIGMKIRHCRMYSNLWEGRIQAQETRSLYRKLVDLTFYRVA